MLPGHRVHNLAIFTDLYELTMLQAYVEAGMEEQATFSLFTRRLPKRRNYLLACGLDDVLSYLESLRFDEESLEYLASLGMFKDSFLSWLRDFRFTGDVHAIPEGTPVFANEPILEITAPIAEAQLAKTFIVNQIHLQTTLASKAARVVTAARGRAVALSSISAPDASTGRMPPSKRRERSTSPALPQPRMSWPTRSMVSR